MDLYKDQTFGSVIKQEFQDVNYEFMFQKHMMKVFYCLNYFMINIKVSNFVERNEVKFSVNPVNFLTTFLQIINKISVGDKTTVIKEIIKTHVQNKNLINDIKSSNSGKLAHYKDFLFILEFFEKMLNGE